MGADANYTGSVLCDYKGLERNIAKDVCIWHLQRRDPECLNKNDCSFRQTWPNEHEKIVGAGEQDK